MMSLSKSAGRRRTFKSFDQAPRDGTPFHVPYIFRWNRFAKTYEALMRNQMSGEMEWEPYPRLWQASYFCDLLPLSFEPPKSLTVMFVATPARPKTWHERLIDRMFGWLRLPDVTSMMQYCWQASVDTLPEGGDAVAAPFTGSAVPKADAQTPSPGHSS
jgi:hypothetical protein